MLAYIPYMDPMGIGVLQSNQLCEASFSNQDRVTARAIELKVDAHVTRLLSKIHLRGLPD